MCLAAFAIGVAKSGIAGIVTFVTPFITMTMLANASAPIIAMYLLAIDLEKEDFAGTNAWFLMTTNILKLPFSFALGIRFVKRVPQKAFNSIIQILSVLAGLRLLF